ncbi:MAG: Asp-tRNA(Asn)/Glu-tRNA(Gln) amidotransferase subunit GatB [Planctomycetota bacterium]
MTDYEIVIGLEVHTQLKTDSKLFCGCSTVFGSEPNSQTCPVCLGLPGVLPVVNRNAFEHALKIAIALNCQIAPFTKFDRKNYFYPDLPKNYQISQYDIPVAKNGWLEIGDNTRSSSAVIPAKSGIQEGTKGLDSRLHGNDKGVRRIGITRVHLEEDAGKLIHPEIPNPKSQIPNSDYSLVDLNRTGVPLVEIVSQPEIQSPEEAYQYLIELKSLLIYLGVSDCDMEKGSLRCDANISVRPKTQKNLSTKVEIKNLNSFKFVAKALEYEANRQINCLKEGKEIIGETRLWDETKEETRLMRSKEEIQDYRYFPEPDLMPFTISPEWLKAIKNSLPELPAQRKERFIKQYQLSEYDAGVLVQEKARADYFEESVKCYNSPKTISNLLMNNILEYLKRTMKERYDIIVKPERLAELAKMRDKGMVTSAVSAVVINALIDNPNASVYEIIKEKGLEQISDDSVIEGYVKEVIAKNDKIVGDYKGGKKAALESLLGQVMRLSKGKAQPDKVRTILQKHLGN